ncbi:MAG: PAS domain S-box protein [Gammaproteobacteria bacterium]
MSTGTGDDYAELSLRYAAVIEAAVDGIIIIDQHGIIETFNPAAERIFGYRGEEVVGANVSVLMPASEASRHDGYIHHYLATGQAHIIGIGRQVVGRRKSGEEFPLELAVGELARLEPRRFVGTVRDITRRRMLESALAARERELSMLLDHAPIGIFSAAMSGRFVRVNPALCAMVRYPAAQLERMAVSDLTYEADRERLREAYVAVCEGRQEECRCDLRWVRADGATMHVSLHAVTVAGERDIIIGQVVDRTEQVRSERESREAGERLAHVGRVTTLGEMASAIAHEINQPLTAISAYAQACRRLLLQPTPDIELVGETLESISGQALRAGDVVRRIRGFVSHRESARSACDLNTVVQSVLEFADFDLRSHQVDVKTVFAGDLPPVMVDPIQIQQVCLNLVRNAIDAMDALPLADRRLLLRTLATADGVVLRCIDSGPGVDAEIRARLFQPFQTTKAEGMGMGLSISASIVAAHGGTLRYADDQQEGACFVMELPAALE